MVTRKVYKPHPLQYFMAYDATITTEDEVDVMAGKNVDTTGATADRKADLVKQAESFLCGLTRYNIVDNYDNLNDDVKKIFNEYGARYAGMSLIAFNMAGFTTRAEAEDMINIHWARLLQIEELLSDQKTITWIKGA